jgi:hypothetical protein
MPIDPKECREHASRCLKLANEIPDAVLKDSLTETALRWERLAASMDATDEWLIRADPGYKRTA